MGMFDTIHLTSPLVCPVCGGQENSYQTHAFDDVMANYRIGSRIGGRVLTGIVQERFWCSACHKAGNSAESPVYLVVWHSILVGVEQDLARAEACLSAVDRLDLIGWLDEAQRNENQWKRRFYGLFSDVRRFSDHLEREKNPEPVAEGETAEETERRKSIKRLWSLPDEILAAPDPLIAILERNTPDQDDDHQDGIWD